MLFNEQLEENGKKARDEQLKSNHSTVGMCYNNVCLLALFYFKIIYINSFAVLCIDESKKVIQDSLDQFDNPYHSSTTCTAG